MNTSCPLRPMMVNTGITSFPHPSDRYVMSNLSLRGIL
jgi:hypothetical protein